MPVTTYIKNSRSSKLLLVVLFITFLAYLPALKAGFVWDDHELILHWPVIHNFDVAKILAGDLPGTHIGAYRPLRNLYSSANYKLFQTQPFGYHLMALIIHLSITGLVFLISHHLTADNRLSFFISLLFGLHPTHVEAIAWITASNDILGYIFLLTAFLVYIKKKPSQKYNFAIGFLAFFAFLTYEITLVLPLICILYDWFFRSSIRFSRLKSIAFAFAGYWFLRLVIVEGSLGRSVAAIPWIEQRLLAQVLTLGKYIQLMIWPYNLNNNHQLTNGLPAYFALDYDFTSPISLNWLQLDVIFAILLICLILMLAIFYRSKKPIISFSLGWFLVSLVPVLQIVPQPILLSERYAYLASVGFVIFLVVTFNHFGKRLNQTSFNVIFSLIALSYGLATFNRTHIWYSDFTFWQDSLKKNPTSASAHSLLAAEYEHRNDFETAMILNQQAVALNPSVTSYKHQLGELYKQTGQWSELIILYKPILKDYPTATTVLKDLANASVQLGQYQQARNFYQKLLEINPDDIYIKQQLSRIENFK